MARLKGRALADLGGAWVQRDVRGCNVENRFFAQQSEDRNTRPDGFASNAYKDMYSKKCHGLDHVRSGTRSQRRQNLGGQNSEGMNSSETGIVLSVVEEAVSQHVE